MCLCVITKDAINLHWQENEKIYIFVRLLFDSFKKYFLNVYILLSVSRSIALIRCKQVSNFVQLKCRSLTTVYV